MLRDNETKFEDDTVFFGNGFMLPCTVSEKTESEPREI